MTARNKHCDQVRAWLDKQEGAQWLSEITAAMRQVNPKWRSSVVSAMVSGGWLVKHEQPGQPASYTVGKRPPTRLTAAQKKERQQSYEKKRSAKRLQQRRAAGIKPRPRPTKHLRPLEYHPQPRLHGEGETVEQFVARGGRVEQLGGLKESTVFARRKPVIMGRGAAF